MTTTEISPSVTKIMASVSTLTSITLAYLLYKQNKRYNSGSIEHNSVYETKQSLYEYLLMHYGTTQELLPTQLIQQNAGLHDAIDYPRQCALTVCKFVQQPKYRHLTLSILEIGCSVGRTAFELTNTFTTVRALDYSQSFIDAANVLKQTGQYKYERKTEGILTVPATAIVNPQLKRDRVRFIQGDACNLNNSQLLHENYGNKYSVILACNLLCRLPKPRQFLDNLTHLVVSEGLVVFMSPYSWLDQFTPRSEWIGGYIDDTGKRLDCNSELIREMTQRGFKLLEEGDMPFFIRETARKSQWTIAHKTVFQKQ